MSDDNKKKQRIKLKNVRISYPSLFDHATYQGVSKEKYEATFLLSKSDKATVKVLKDAIAEAKDQTDKTVPKGNTWCMVDGDGKTDERLHDHYLIKASSKNRPLVIDRAKNLLTKEDAVIYGGCFVNASIDIWLLNNGKNIGVQANLHGVQFAKDGDSFGSGPSKEQVMEDFDDDNSDDDFDDDEL